MNFFGLVTDYDGTLAYSGKVRESTLNALERLRDSGRKLLLVTGRQLPELLEIFPRPDLFEWIVAENGGLLYCPHNRETRLLAEPVPQTFPDLLRERGVQNLQVGQSIVATWVPNEHRVLDALRDLGLDRQIIFNKDAVMVLPSGVNKAFGLTAALEEMKLSHHNVVAIGDAENDLPMLTQCECGAAVDNALESVKHKADLVMTAGHGAGVEELIEDLLKDDLAGRLSKGDRTRGLLLGKAKDTGKNVFLPSLGQSILVAGPSGSGKSTSITGLLERMAKAAYQFCILDPEGDYETFEPAINTGSPHYVPSRNDVVSLLERMHNAVVNMLGVALDSRPQFASELLRKLQDLRSRSGRPHWFVIDEAHHIFPSEVPAESTLLAEPPKTSLMITVHPNHVRKEALDSMDIVIAVGKDPQETIRDFCRALGAEEPTLNPVALERGEVLLWFRRTSQDPLVVATEPGKTEHKRHIRKYAEGDLGVGSFVFRGPEGKLKLVAHNLNTFIRMAEGVDDDTWCHHLRAGEFSEWFRWIVKNESLADQVKSIEQQNASAEATRETIIEAIRAQYTLSA
ncbi:HAD-IIB family hydrolase [Edaphobacter sp. HDX4]|uniref:HAD-IIB family hydrolase n=1 Tax=Edaphobacter sp. HDX4 TaxID=2794064 RepID=UPI002FE669CF